ncbi:ankyrin repeat-containing domain protein [Aspergillus heterothallicus]
MSDRRTEESQNELDPPPLYRPPSPAPSYRTLDIRVRESLSRPRTGLTGRIISAIVPRSRGRDNNARTPAATADRAGPPPPTTQSVARPEQDVPVVDSKSANCERPVPPRSADVKEPDTKKSDRVPAPSKSTEKNEPKPPIVYTKEQITAFEIAGSKARCAIETNDEKGLLQVLRENQKCDWNTPLAADGSTRLLHIAAELGRTSMLATILEQGVEIFVEDVKGYTPLYLATLNRHATAMQILVAAEADFRPLARKPTLALAAERGDERTVQALLDPIVAMYTKNKYNYGSRSQIFVALHAAGKRGRQTITTLLYNITCDMSYADVRGHHHFLLLYPAIEYGWRDLTQSIITSFHQAGEIAKIATAPQFLISAAGRGDTDIVEQLLRVGCPVNSASDGTMYALHHAAAMGRVEAVRLLLAWGADPTLIDYYGGNALNEALRGGASVELVRMLLERGVDVHVRDSFGETPYQRAQSFLAGEVGKLIKEYAGPGAAIKEEKSAYLLKVQCTKEHGNDPPS